MRCVCVRARGGSMRLELVASGELVAAADIYAEMGTLRGRGGRTLAVGAGLGNPPSARVLPLGRRDAVHRGGRGAARRHGMNAARRERKVVTVLFADLVGFTSRAESLDPEDVEAILAALPRAAAVGTRALRRHGREVHRRRGDGALRRAGRARGRRGAGRPRGARDPRLGRGGGRARGADRDHDRGGARLARRAPGGGAGNGVGRRREHGRAPAGRGAR